jgi:hypothetical protein
MKTLFLFVLGLAALSACKKESEDTPSPSRTELLTAKNWRLTAYTSTATVTGSSSSSTTRDMYALIPACLKDDFFKFNTDKTFVSDEGPIACGAPSPKLTYNWDFNNDQTKIVITTPASPVDFGTITELSATTLRLRNTGIRTASGTITTTVDDVTYTAF